MAEGHGARNPENAYYVALYSAMTEADLATQGEREGKRTDYWSWKRFHMSVAFLSAKRSRDPRTKVQSGTILVTADPSVYMYKLTF